MQDHIKLKLIKIVHTLVWVFFVSLIFYVLYCGVINQVTALTWVAVGLVFLEGLVLVLFKNSCPLTILARQYSDSSRDNFDIYLPNWLARYNKQIFTTIFTAGLLLVLYRVLL